MTESPQLAPGQEKHETYSIVVNGRPKTVEHAKLSYERMFSWPSRTPDGARRGHHGRLHRRSRPQSDGLLTKRPARRGQGNFAPSSVSARLTRAS